MFLEYDSLQIQEHEEERLEVLPTVSSPLELTAELAERFAQYIAYYKQEDRLPSYPYGVILAQKRSTSGMMLFSER